MLREVRVSVFILSLVLLVGGLSAPPAFGAGLDFSKAVIVTGPADTGNREVGRFLQLEIERRSGISLKLARVPPKSVRPVVALGTVEHFPIPYALPDGLTVPDKGEGFALWVESAAQGAPVLFLIGRDNKGLLFAAGELLRKLYLANDFVQVDESLRASSAPVFPVRGQQILVDVQNEERFIDWKDTSQVEQYIRDLALFGNNTIEPTLDKDDFNPIADYCERLGIDLALTVNCDEIIALYAEPDEAIRNWRSDVKGIDQFVTYGGDHSGARPPFKTFPAMERVVPILLEGHPGATWWYSNQCMGGETTSHAVTYNDFVFDYLQEKQPTWLHGMIYGPWTRDGIPDTRASLPKQYALRHYPDICHIRWCMYPVPKWEHAWAQVWTRAENIYAMPRMMRAVHNAHCKDMVGSTSYNHTGASNDLNKFVFAAMDWNPDGDLMEFMRDYARVFFAWQFVYDAPSPEAIDTATDKVARALFGLEDNWTGPLATNPSPEQCLKDWKNVVALMGGPGRVRDNWRLDMFLTRALIDAQVKKKYDAELKFEGAAYAALEQAATVGVSTAIANARAELARIETEFQPLADFEKEMESWGISDRYGDRDKTLALLYLPLTDRNWLEAQLANATTVADLQDVLGYEDPGPGGFYDDLGDEARQPHLVRQRTWEEDPGFVYSPFDWIDAEPDSARRHSQQTHALTRYDTPLIMRWENLDINAHYSIDVVYGGPFGPEFRCDTDDGFEIHKTITTPEEVPVRFEIPPATTRDGVLQLEWRLVNTTRGVSVAEIWLRKGGK